MWYWPRRAKSAPDDTGKVRQHKAQTEGRQSGAPLRAGDLTREVAAVSSELGAALGQFGGGMPRRDPLLGDGSHAQGLPAPDSAYDYPYGLFEEALDKDAHLQALIGQRKAAVLSWERSLRPAGASPEACMALELVRQGLEHIGAANLDRDLWELLDALPFGLAISEVVWEWVELKAGRLGGDGLQQASAPEPAGCALPPGRYLLPKALLSRHPRRFVFSAEGELRLLTSAEPLAGEPLPPRRFIVFAPYGRHESPYGTALLRTVWWSSWFKRQALRFWLLHCEKYGMPTAVLTHPLEATEDERRAFRRVVGSIQQETGLVVPQGVELSLLEAARSGGPAAYQALIELCNSEMSKAILGQTLTVDTPPGAGGHASFAMAQVHEHVREDLTRLDAQALMGCLNSTLLRWIVELNGGQRVRPGDQDAAAAPAWPAVLAPTWLMSPPRRDDLRLQLEIDRFFAERGLGVDGDELYQRYGRKDPARARAWQSGGTRTP